MKYNIKIKKKIVNHLLSWLLEKVYGIYFPTLKSLEAMYYKCDKFYFLSRLNKRRSTFKVCNSSLKAVTWQSGYKSRAFIHLQSANPPTR